MPHSQSLGETLGISSDVTLLQIGRFADVLTLEDVPVNQESDQGTDYESSSEAARRFFCQQRKRRRKS